tara:strand:+ start:369 stop:596 length:228 start_codon:yes stop_codon:yes gene_type:complete
MNFDIPGGFAARSDGRGGYIVSRPPPTVVYPCGICGINREEMMNKRMTQVHILPCYSCSRQEYEEMRSKIEQGLI